MKIANKTFALALLCLIALHGSVQASRLGSARRLSQVSGGLGGVYANTGNGIVVVNTVVYASGGVVIYDSGLCADGTVVYLAGGIVFGTIYGGIIYPPQQATYFPPAIVSVVIFGPIFAQSWFFGPSGVVVWSTTIFYRAGGVRIYNPIGYSGPFYNEGGVQIGTFSNSVARVDSNTVITQNNINVNAQPTARQVETPEAAGKAPISSAVGQPGVTVTPGAAPASPTAADKAASDRSGSPRAPTSPGSSPRRNDASPGVSGSPDSRSPGISSSPDSNRRSGSPSADNDSSRSPPQAGARSPAANGSPSQNGGDRSPAGDNRGSSPDSGNGNRRGNDNSSPGLDWAGDGSGDSYVPGAFASGDRSQDASRGGGDRRG